MGRMERRKGAGGELEVAAIFREAGFDCDRTPNSGGLRLRGDLYGALPVHVEVKRQEVLRLPLWLRRAAEDAGQAVPVVAFRQNRGGWYAALELAELVRLLAAAAELEELRMALAEALTSPPASSDPDGELGGSHRPAGEAGAAITHQEVPQ